MPSSTRLELPSRLESNSTRTGSNLESFSARDPGFPCCEARASFACVVFSLHECRGDMDVHTKQCKQRADLSASRVQDPLCCARAAKYALKLPQNFHVRFVSFSEHGQRQRSIFQNQLICIFYFSTFWGEKSLHSQRVFWWLMDVCMFLADIQPSGE